MGKKESDDKSEAVEGELLAEEMKDIAKDVPPEVVKKIIRVTTTKIRSEWSGPLPPPSVFRQYPHEVQKAIVTQATAQMRHRHSIERQVVASNIQSSKQGMTFAFWLTTLMIGAGTLLVALGHSTAGLVAIFGTGGFQGANYLYQKWREMQKASQNANQQNDEHVSKKDQAIDKDKSA